MHRRELWCLAGFLVPATLTAQDLERRVLAVASGAVHLSFAARPGVCGDGTNNISTRRDNEDWESDCENGPVRVALRIRDHQVVGLRTYVGGRWREPSAATDLGTVRPQDAATYFINLAESRSEIDGDPVLPATLADSVTVWPSLLRLARDPGLPSDRRREAVFWLGQAAEAAAGLALDSVVSDPHGDRDVRKQAVFALSQRDPDESVPRLIHIVKTNRDPELRKTALFWLGQSEDPRALELFEQILQ
jgi:HEAT repeats